jgi:hypothetical protein
MSHPSTTTRKRKPAAATPPTTEELVELPDEEVTPAPPADTRIVIDPDDLTLDEVEEVETLLGAPIDTLFTSNKPRAAALKAVLLVVKRRTDPDTTLADVGSVKLSELSLLGE